VRQASLARIRDLLQSQTMHHDGRRDSELSQKRHETTFSA
jgi:hypothetical protein